MPDDEKVEVTEQQESQDFSSEDGDFSSGWGSEKQPDREEKVEEEKKTEKQPPKEKAEKKEEAEKKEKPKEKKAPAKKAKAESSTGEETQLEGEEKEKKAGKEAEQKAEGDKEGEKAEEDEAEARGKELLEQEKKAEEEAQKAKEDEERKKAEEEARKGPKYSPPYPVNENLAKIFLDLADIKNIPENLRVGDTDLALREFISANPEFAVLAGSQAINVVQRLVDNGMLMTKEAHEAAIQKITEDVDSKMFDLAIRVHIPNPAQLWESKEFKDWHDKASDTIKALFRSADPQDHVKGFRKYLARATAAVKEKVAEHDEKLRLVKKTHEDIHTHTMRSGSANIPEVVKSLQESDEEFSAGFRGDE
jgi:hypothetical protein